MKAVCSGTTFIFENDCKNPDQWHSTFNPMSYREYMYLRLLIFDRVFFVKAQQLLSGSV